MLFILCVYYDKEWVEVPQYPNGSQRTTYRSFFYNVNLGSLSGHLSGLVASTFTHRAILLHMGLLLEYTGYQ